MKPFGTYLKEKSSRDKLDKYVSDEIKKRKLAKHPVNATDDIKMRRGKPTFKFPSPTGDMVIHVWLRPMAKPAKSHTKAFNYQLEDK